MQIRIVVCIEIVTHLFFINRFIAFDFLFFLYERFDVFALNRRIRRRKVKRE